MNEAAHGKSQVARGALPDEYARIEVRHTNETPHSRPSINTASGPRSKRIFDFTITLFAAPLWLPVVAICAFLILLLEGRPVFYLSQRQIALGRVRPVLKFRTMRRDADKIINRDTVPVTNTAFLNVARNSEIYTPIGNIIERLALTELPQLFHVMRGNMSLIGSRPLPARVMDVLRSKQPDADLRFLTRAGLTGPVQLVGRDAISDTDRLRLETRYCQIASSDDYSIWLDLWLLGYTALVVIAPSQLLTAEQVSERMNRFKRSAEQPMLAPSKAYGGSEAE